ncbi:WYL domain-containing protein [Riemerella anatipestifer]|uniref:helix-turn-helix transcriptional regulator n=1 Tax=Riemerella anatipestifer TaxID=34085 RepID=UPI00285B0892|nr:WYL domain-containing protein [Riemerella anatipestifer]MDR7716708.1 WYL domain-containing protein [Riemerella anatipestifer]MDR7741544.1 WYL domain-containing protein [Riemerella anatipestifer]
MSTNKNAQIRYKALDECFSNIYHKYFIEDLIAYCNEKLTDHFMEETSISRRQVLEDIKFMESQAGFEAPIVRYREGKRVYYRYEDADFSILKKSMTDTERNTLRQALETLNRLNSLPGFGWVQSIQTKLDIEITELQRQNKIIDFQENEYLKGLEFLNPLYQFILKEQVLSVHYKSFRDRLSVFTMSPYFLKQFNNRWFLFGWEHHFHKVQNIALDRIVSIDVISEVYHINEIDFVNYFDEIIGVTNVENDEVEEIKIELTDYILPYIASKLLHSSQRVKGHVLHLSVKINQELKALILSHGENMRVISPLSLVEELQRIIQRMKNNYDFKK